MKKVKDNRNLKLLKEGKIMVGTAADMAMSAGDRLKRQNLEQESTAKAKNPNYSVSKVRDWPRWTTHSLYTLNCPVVLLCTVLGNDVHISQFV